MYRYVGDIYWRFLGGTAEKRLDLNVYTGQTISQQFGQQLPTLLNHHLARLDI